MPDTDAKSKTCPQCGAPIATGAPEGLCPRCVAALNLFADTAPTGAATIAPQPAPTPEEIASHFPQLEVIEYLGRGGMGVVYRARQKALGRLVALKLLAPERADDANFAERFAREAQALATLNHPNIVTIYDFGQAGRFYYLLMEFVDGVNLRQAMVAGRFTPEQALAIVPPICEALQYAHEHGIVHRDIKPENLLLDKEGRVKIADFGVAKMLGAEPTVGVAESQPAGTPQYMAPEQMAHRATDHRADIYSLGVVLYEMLTGELPADKLQPPSRRVQVDVRIDEIVLRALEAKPELRFATAAEFRTQVETITSPPAVHATTPRPPASFVAFAVLLLVVGLLIPLIGIRMHNSAILSAAEDHMKFIRSLQDGVTSLSAQIGEANAVAGRAASRAGNSAEREETRAQAREEQRTYEQRSVNLRADLTRLQAALAAAGNQQVDGHPWRLVLILVTGLALTLAGGGMLLQIRRRSGAGIGHPPPMPTVHRPFKYAWLVPLIPLLILGVIFARFVSEVRSPSGVTSFDLRPVEVRDNVVIVDVTTVVARGNAELRSMLRGARLPAATEAALERVSFAPFAGTLIKPTPHDGNPACRILSPGQQMWRLGFALPNAALAKEAFANLRPLGPIPAPGRTFAGTLFEVGQPGGDTYRASLEVGPPLTASDPRWVEVIGHSQQDASTISLTWEVFASQLGLAQFSRAGSPIMVLKRQPQSELYGVTAGLELTRLDADRVLFVRHIGHHTLREEIPGNFRDLAEELLRTKTMSAKTTCGTTIELCQFQGNPFTVQLQTHGGPLKTTVFAPVRVVDWTIPFVAVLLVGIVLAVVLVRKRASAGKAVLWVAGALLLLLAVAFAVMPAVRRISRDFGPGATVVRMPQPPQNGDQPGAEQLEKSPPAASLPEAQIPDHIEFKVLRVENPPGTRDILLHFERDANYGLAIEVWQDVTASPDGKAPKEGYRAWQQKTRVGLHNGRILGWTLPEEFSEAEVSSLAREMEQKWKGSHPLPDGAVPEFATALHRDGWKYHLVTRVLREPGAPYPPAPTGANFTIQQHVFTGAGRLVQFTLKQRANDGAPQVIGEPLFFKTGANCTTGFRVRLHAYDSGGEKPSRVVVDIVDPNTDIVHHRFEHGFGLGVKFQLAGAAALPERNPPISLENLSEGAETRTLIDAEHIVPPGAASRQRWEVLCEIAKPDEASATALFQLPPANGTPPAN